MTATAPARIGSLRFARAYGTTMRPYLLFLSGQVGLAGLALAPRIETGWTLLLGAAFFLSYGFGQALTDCFQLDTDSLSAPYRPLVRGTVRQRDVALVSLTGLLGVGALLTIRHPFNAVLAVSAVVGLATYTRFKRRPSAGPLYNAAVVAVLFVMGYLAGVGPDGGPALPWPAVLATLTAVFFGYANFVLTGYFKDITADRRTGYRTLPVARGLPFSRSVSHALALAQLVGAGLAAVLLVAGSLPEAGGAFASPGRLVALALTDAGVGAAVLGQLRVRHVGERDAHRAIAPVVDANLLLLAGLTGLARPAWAPWLVLYYLGYRWTLCRRPMERQI